MTLPNLAARQLKLAELSAKVFGRAFDPQGRRTGEQILRQRLVGKQVASYYPEDPLTFKELQKLYPNEDLVDLEDGARITKLTALKRRGKGAPKK
ncbi:mitochondral 37S ribosomal protein S27, partial [Dimargaris verticillata]